MADCLIAKATVAGWAGSGIPPASLYAPGVRERSHCCWRQPQRVDDAKVLEASLGAGPAEHLKAEEEKLRSLRGQLAALQPTKSAASQAV